jgi:hypothetical protein
MRELKSDREVGVRAGAESIGVRRIKRSRSRAIAGNVRGVISS